jgi:hypothetical protein
MKHGEKKAFREEYLSGMLRKELVDFWVLK